jgi:hypothetical protein
VGGGIPKDLETGAAINWEIHILQTPKDLRLRCATGARFLVENINSPEK